jgi:hypothetical protein
MRSVTTQHKVAAALVVVAGAAAGGWLLAQRPAASDAAVSQPYLVARACHRNRHAEEACRVALHYLRAMDVDRFREACSQLSRDTLDVAGGMDGCVRKMSKARGNRIRYGIHEVHASVLGYTIFFRTQARDRSLPALQQVMLLAGERGRLRIVTVQPDPYPRH